jgi:polysaccharide biosynthesis protein PslH
MKILWVKSDFLHPTTRGGQIRTLEMVKRLHRKHEVHYIAFADRGSPEGVQRSGEYSTRAYPIEHRPPAKKSLGFAVQIARGFLSPMPVIIDRWRSREMERKIAELMDRERFDSVVCDFLTPAPNLGDFLEQSVLFQHNVEMAIWRRHAEHAPDTLRRFYFGLQADRMFAFEKKMCARARCVVAVSEADARSMREMFGVKNVSTVATGVDVDYFQRPEQVEPTFDIVFVGSMDWMPNQDGIRFFMDQILPAIRAKLPECTVGIVGRTPSAELIETAKRDGRMTVTGTVPDVRPFLWGSAVSIVPLRVGGGTRLKIYEAMAAGTPVISTTIGAEGLDVSPGQNICIADAPDAFAAACIDLLRNRTGRDGLAAAGRELVETRFSWEAVTAGFERILVENAGTGAAL